MSDHKCTDLTAEPESCDGASADAALSDSQSIEARFQTRLEEIFRRLRQHNVPFCVLRNRDRIPRGLLEGSDVDVIVPAGTRPSDLLQIVGDLRPVHVIPHRGTLEIYFPVGPLLLHVDFLISDREWRGARYLENQAILDSAQDDDGIPVASLVHQAFCAWFSSLTRRRRFKPRYIPLITSAVNEAGEQMRALLSEAFGPKLGDELLQLAQRGELERSDEYAKPCRRAIWLRALRRRPLATLRGLLGYYIPEARHWMRPPGLAIAVLGPDGSGKSAVGAALSAASRALLPFSAVQVQHLYERALPRLSELKHGRLRRKPAGPAAVHDPHGKRPHGRLASIFSLSYACVDMWLSRLFIGRPLLARNALLVHDRYMREIVVDSKRFRYAGPAWLARLFSRLTPPLDLIILLDAPAEVLQQRKQEVPFEETRRQREAYRALVQQLPNGRIVSADQPLEQVIEDVRQALLQCLAAGTATRFRLKQASPATAAPRASVAFGLPHEGST